MCMKYQPISPEVYIQNRAKFMQAMKPKSIAIFNSNDIYPISADSTLPFSQHRDIFYLSGIDQEETILLLFPDAVDPKHQQILFLRETNQNLVIWEGAKLSQQQALELSGIKTVYWLQDFEKVLLNLMAQADCLYFNTNEHHRQKVETQTREDRFIAWAKQAFPAHAYAKSNPILQSLRSIKDYRELQQISTACQITEKGFRRILNFVKPGVWEYQIEAEYIHEFLKNRSKGFAYTPIIASGHNANILHYIDNNKQCQDGQLLLMDVGAEYGNYSSDMTRTIPVNGRFNARQKAVYQAVNKVKKQATSMLTPGTLLKEYEIEVGKIMTSELIGLGLLDKADIQSQDNKNPAYKKYFMHGTSHHLGLDTHDYGVLWDPIQANMVFTVEPGIYIQKEGLGIRLEDDVVVQPTGQPKNLMQNIPIEIEEIEDLMNS